MTTAELLKAIRVRIRELEKKLRDEPPGENHASYLLSGEIEGLEWVLELLE